MAAVNYKILGQIDLPPTTDTLLYAVPALTETITSSLIVCNRNNATVTFRIAVVQGGGIITSKDYIYYNLKIAAFDTFIATVGLTLSAGDEVYAYADLNKLAISLYGSELT